ncbi:MAG: hypothetical protein HY852_16970 [Bradyrhizobium sp.]|uniref:DUF6969 family protein n=1 Tax=Bradyrhizobium sp. TaxID=376 RepID=UPI0025BD8D1D|nr:hypothetical protein [Bradyrhizobium sp.]MBI5263505.1 hypothetical protein [Bradyrhizobium sp.]
MTKTTAGETLPGSARLSREVLARMADAAVIAVDCIHALHEQKSNLVMEALRGSDSFTEWDHYPANDARDPLSHAHYFLHAHSPEGRDRPDYAHFHTFMRVKGMPPGIRPVDVGAQTGEAGGEPMSHLVAISMTPSGMPERLFTTNRWVTAETWYRAPDVIAMLDGFVLELDEPSPLLNRWLTAMLVLFRPHIEHLLIERDAAVERWRRLHPGVDVFEDRRLDITSSLDISLHQHVAWLDSRLEACS